MIQLPLSFKLARYETPVRNSVPARQRTKM
jgi:hypothetical protein